MLRPILQTAQKHRLSQAPLPTLLNKMESLLLRSVGIISLRAQIVGDNLKIQITII